MDDDYSLDDIDVQALDRIADQVIRSRSTQSPADAGSSNQTAQTGQNRNASTRATPLQQPVPKKVGSSSVSTIVVSPRQKGNPTLQHLRNVPWEYGDIVPDYLIGSTIAVLFLSLKYHRLHPEYIYNRITKTGKNFLLRVILVIVDIENHAESIKELTKTSVVNGLTVILAWSAQEAGHYLSSFGVLKSAPPTAIQAPQKEDFSERIVDVLTSVRGVNKSDAASLMSTFGSLRNAVRDEGRTMSDIGGWGDLKVRRFRSAVTEPFVMRRSGGSAFASSLAQRKAGPPMEIIQPRATESASNLTQTQENSQQEGQQNDAESYQGIMAEIAKLRKAA